MVGSTGEKAMIMFRKEVKLLSSLRHPNILEYIGEVTSESRQLILVTELMGLSLFDEIGVTRHGKPWPLSERLFAMVNVANGLAYLHSRVPVVIHRDLKSHNLLMEAESDDADFDFPPESSPGGKRKKKVRMCKIADLGISRLKMMTQTMTSVGTPQWMAPEALRGERYVGAIRCDAQKGRNNCQKNKE
jgi:serine/threonine protein kinase